MYKLSVAGIFAGIVLSSNLNAAPIIFNFEGIIDYVDASSDFGIAGAVGGDTFIQWLLYF